MKIAFLYMNIGSGVGVGSGYVFASIPDEHERHFFNVPQYQTAYETTRWLLISNYDLVMISTSTLFAPLAFQIAVAVHSHVPVLLGGIHAIIFGGELLRDHPELDYVCTGEGETFVQEFLKKWKTPEFFEIPGLAYRKGTEIVVNPEGPLEDLSKLPEFPWKAFPKLMNERGFIYFHVARGCRFACTYCGNSVCLRKYGRAYLRQRPISKVIEEMQHFRDTYHPKLFFFEVEEMFSELDWATELFQAVKDQVGVPYGCMARSESLNADLVSFMKRTGCEYVGIGVECGDEDYRRSVLKRFTTTQEILESFRLCNEAGFLTTSYNMIGYPTERDEEICRTTIALNRELNPGIFQVTWFYPFPGTVLGDYCRENNLIDLNKIGQMHTYHGQGSVLKMHGAKPADPHEYLRSLGGW